MLRISWTKKVSNVEVLQRMQKNPEVLSITKRRKLQYHARRKIQNNACHHRGPNRRETIAGKKTEFMVERFRSLARVLVTGNISWCYLKNPNGHLLKKEGDEKKNSRDHSFELKCLIDSWDHGLEFTPYMDSRFL
jgi:hypothetical protein